MEAAAVLDKQGISATVIDLRTVSPLDRETVCEAVAKSGRLLVVDEDYREFGLSGELAASILEAGILAKFGGFAQIRSSHMRGSSKIRFCPARAGSSPAR